MPNVEISLIDGEFRRVMGQLIAGASDLSPLMAAISGHFAAAAERAFDAESNPANGTPWQPLAPSTMKQRTRRGTWPGSILQVSGELAASGVAQHGRDFAELVFGAPHAVYHQFGTKKMAARPFLGVDALLESDIRSEAIAHLNRLSS